MTGNYNILKAVFKSVFAASIEVKQMEKRIQEIKLFGLEAKRFGKSTTYIKPRTKYSYWVNGTKITKTI